jgi:hypothetical protein
MPAPSAHGGEADLPLPTVQRLCCDGAIVPIINGADGEPLNVGRKQRIATTALGRAVYARDRTCTFPGCHHERYGELHHVEHWANGGETSLENIVLLCSTHHRLVHEGGFTVQQHRDGRYYFARPDGRPVETPRTSSRDCVEEPRPLYRVVKSSAEDEMCDFAHLPGKKVFGNQCGRGGNL